MNDLIFPNSGGTKPAKPVTCCWGCGKEQGSNERFKQCRKCVDQKVIPAKFCSDECFQSSWQRHKQWHDQQKIQLSRLPNSPSQDALNALAERSEYDSQMALANIRINNVDIASAKTILERAVKLDPTRPEAYYNLAVCFEASGQLKQAAFYYEYAIERWALVALTGVIGGFDIEEERHPSWALQQWSTAVDFVTRLYMTREFAYHSKPEWYRIDGLLHLVSKTASNASLNPKVSDSMKKKARLSLLQAFAASGMIHNGIFYQSSSLVGNNKKSSADLLEAAACFRFVTAAARVGAELGFRNDDLHSYHSHARTCTNLSELKMNKEVNQLSDSVGSWVAIRSNPQGESKARFGQVTGPLNREGKVPIKVEDCDRPLFVTPSARNLVPSPQNEQSNALVACLDKETQWKFMSSIFETLHEQGLLSRS